MLPKSRNPTDFTGIFRERETAPAGLLLLFKAIIQPLMFGLDQPLQHKRDTDG